MRKQTKVVAVASAAALLAIGGAMTSFAAQGWVEEDGTWYYYDKDGNRVENEWRKSGDSWFWLDGDEGGAMATDKLIEDDDIRNSEIAFPDEETLARCETFTYLGDDADEVYNQLWREVKSN